MHRALSRTVVKCSFAVALLSYGARADASTGYEFPENGTEQLGRAGAWTARASGPLATYFNPAGLAGQKSAVQATLNLIWQENCFERRTPSGDVAQAFRRTYAPKVCNTDSDNPYPNSQLALSWRVTDKLGLGFAVLGPSTRGRFSYPELAEGTRTQGQTVINEPVPAPQRYLMISDDLFVAWPQIGIGYEVLPDLRLGASFIWGVASLELSSYAAGMAQPATGGVDAFEQDVRADLKVKDWFVPGFTLGAMYSPSRYLDVGAWYHWSDDIKAKGDAVIKGPMYTAAGKANTDLTVNETDGAGVTAPWPMEVRVGFRFHVPRESAAASDVRDPLATDLFDIELDLSWTNNSHFDDLGVTFPSGTAIALDTIQVTMPEDASVPHRWKDSFGVRLASDVVVVPNTLSVRAGAFYESERQDPAYLHIDYLASATTGVALGATVRLGDFDLMAGYEHVFYMGLDNEGQGATRGIAGSSTPGFPEYRTELTVNGGSLDSSVDIASVGVSYAY